MFKLEDYESLVKIVTDQRNMMSYIMNDLAKHIVNIPNTKIMITIPNESFNPKEFEINNLYRYDINMSYDSKASGLHIVLMINRLSEQNNVNQIVKLVTSNMFDLPDKHIIILNRSRIRIPESSKFEIRNLN